MDAVDAYIPTPERAIDKPFLMPVEDVFGIKGRGTVATGRIERGIVKVGDEVELVGVKPTRKIVITGVEMFKKLLDEGRAGDNVGCLIRGIEREEIERGQVLAKTGSVKPHTKFTAQVYVLTKEEGGRHTPFYNGYRPAVLPAHDRRDRRHRPARRGRDDHARRQRRDERRADHPDRHRDRPALRHPRGWPDRRRRRHRQHRRVGTTMARVEARPTIQLACTECKERTYTTRKNKKNDPNRIELHEILPARPTTYTSPRGEVGGRPAGV